MIHLKTKIRSRDKKSVNHYVTKMKNQKESFLVQMLVVLRIYDVMRLLVKTIVSFEKWKYFFNTYNYDIIIL